MLKLRGLLVAACIVGSGCTGTSLPAVTTFTATSTGLPTAATIPLTAPPTTPASPAAAAAAAAVACGSVISYASDGAQMQFTLASGSTSTKYRVEYQFASPRPPADIGDQFVSKTPQLIQVIGRQVPADTGSPDSTNLRDATVTRVTSCSATLSVAPAAFTGFFLPQGCGYVRAPVLAVDHSERAFDCPGGTLRAVETLAPAFTEQGWISCATGPGRGYWKKNATMIVVSQSANDNPLLLQYPGTTACP